ncbi:MAG: TonB-dependent receptor [Tannerellaceae bacterium]|nr:TonB-dependent receptor [Tannerellaceae bacterium]
MKKCFYLMLVLLSLASAASAAVDSLIKGKLVEAGSRKPIDFADVLLFANGNENPVSHTLPQSDGSFAITLTPYGEYTLFVRLVGFDVYTRSGIVLSASTPVFDAGVIEMKPLEVGLAEVEVVAQKKQIIYKLDKKVIEASGNLLASGGSAVDILENTPSIRVDAEGNVTFRGSAGFAVYVDGKPSIFSGTQALEQIPSGLIDNIEIITTPSARHDTEGDVGIINIITKKHTQHGFNGMVNVSGSSVYSRAMDFLLARQNNKLRWYLGGSYAERVRKSDFNQEKTTLVTDTATTSHSSGPRRSRGYNYSLKTGWLYSLPQTTFNLDVEGGYGGTNRNGNLDYSEERKAGGAVFEQGAYLSHDRYEIDETYFQGTAGFTHKWNDKGRDLSGSFYAKYGGDALEYFSSDLIDVRGLRQQGHRAYEDEHRWTVRANLDYIHPYRETGRLEAGYQYFSYLEDGDYSMEFWNPSQNVFYWRDDIYNTFYFQRGINSFYAILADSYKSFQFQAGVRAEHTHRVLKSSKEWANRTVNRFEFFPSAHIGYNFPRQHVLMASFSRRTTRPQLFYMEPYITYRDYYSAEIGNPDVRPEYIDSYELNYKKSISIHSLSATLFHRKRKDKIERLRVPYEAGVTLDSMANVGHDYSTGLELNLQVQPIRCWNVNLNGSLYHYKVENEYKLGNSDEESLNYEIALNNGFDMGKYTRIQFDGNFIGPSVTTQGRTDAFWYANLAIRRQLFKRKLNATLAFRDVFNSARYNSRINTAVLQSYTRISPRYPLIMLTLSYAFNNFKTASAGQRETHDLFEGTNH